MEIGQIGIELTPTPILSALGERAGAHEPAYRGGAQAEGTGDSLVRHPLLMEALDSTVAGVAMGTVLLDLRAFPRGEQRAAGHHGPWVPDLVIPHLPGRLVYTGTLAREHPLDGFSQILQHMPTISHLHGVRCSGAGRLSVLRGAVAANNLHARVGLEPLMERLGFPIRQQLHRSMALQID